MIFLFLFLFAAIAGAILFTWKLKELNRFLNRESPIRPEHVLMSVVVLCVGFYACAVANALVQTVRSTWNQPDVRHEKNQTHPHRHL